MESEPGRGSRFRFTARFGRPAARTDDTGARVLARLKNLRVLVVDDNATNRRILEEVLTQWRMRPTTVGGGRAAVLELQRAARRGRPYPLVLLDANMPEMDGFTLAEQIKKHPRLAGASIMMLTSGARLGDRARCLELGVSSYLTKPIKQSDLLDTIMDVLVAGTGRTRVPQGARAAARPTSGRPLRVLVAEDNVVNQEVAVGLLARAGHQAVVASNGREALALLEQEPFDLILMDVQMPELDGLETTAAIREQEASTGRHIPIVAVTAHAMKGDAERCLAAGMDAYVAKPLQARELDPVIGRLTDGATREASGRGTVDEALLLERVGGDRQALRRLVTLFLADAPKLMTRIHQALERSDGSARPVRRPRPQGVGLELRRARRHRGRAPTAAPGRGGRDRESPKCCGASGTGARPRPAGALRVRVPEAEPRAPPGAGRRRKPRRTPGPRVTGGGLRVSPGT